MFRKKQCATYSMAFVQELAITAVLPCVVEKNMIAGDKPLKNVCASNFGQTLIKYADSVHEARLKVRLPHPKSS